MWDDSRQRIWSHFRSAQPAYRQRLPGAMESSTAEEGLVAAAGGSAAAAVAAETAATVAVGEVRLEKVEVRKVGVVVPKVRVLVAQV